MQLRVAPEASKHNSAQDPDTPWSEASNSHECLSLALALRACRQCYK